MLPIDFRLYQPHTHVSNLAKVLFWVEILEKYIHIHVLETTLT